jgi:hypothetical protein
MQKRLPLAVLAVALFVVLSGCAEPERQTVEVPQTVEVTREVTREVTKVVEQVVTQEVEVTRIVTAEPTDTSVPTDTPTPTLTLSPSPTRSATPAPSADIRTSLLEAMRTTRSQMDEFGGLLDEAARTRVLRCKPTVELYDAIVAAPTFDVAASSDTVQWAYGRYREAVDIYSDRSRGLAEQCRNWLEGDAKDVIEPVGWTRARQSVVAALELLIPAIDELE